MKMICSIAIIYMFLGLAVSLTAAGINLNGEYWFCSLSADINTQSPWAKRGTIVVDSNEWTQEWDDYSGHHTFTSPYSTSYKEDGSVNIELSSGTYNIAWHGDLMVHTNIAPNTGSRLAIDIIARKAKNIQTTDVIGTYACFEQRLGWNQRSGSTAWGNLTLNANGTGAQTCLENDGHRSSNNFTWTFDGVNETMNIPGKTPVFFCNNGLALSPESLPISGEIGYNLFIKKSSHTICLADLAGTYYGRFFETTPGGVPTSGEVFVTIGTDGGAEFDICHYDETYDVKFIRFIIGPGNRLKFNYLYSSGDEAYGGEGIISPDRKLIFIPECDGTKSLSGNGLIGSLFLLKNPNSIPHWEFGDAYDENTKLTVNDMNDVIATFSLRGGGWGEIIGGAAFNQVILHDTTAKTQFSITTKGRNQTSVGTITVNGSLKGITAKTTNIRGDISVTGSLGTLIFNDIAQNHGIRIGVSDNPIKVRFGRAKNLTFYSLMPVKSITATDWIGGSIEAPSLGYISIKGDKKRSIPGDLNVDVTTEGIINSIKVAGTLSGTWNCEVVQSITASNMHDCLLSLIKPYDSSISALGKLSIKNWITRSQIQCIGNVSKIMTGAMRDSSCFVGYIAERDMNGVDGVLDLPDPSLDINDYETIGSFIIKGIKSEPYCMINSNVAAAEILNAFLAYPTLNNNGIPFGLATGFIKSMKLKNAQETISQNNLNLKADSLKVKDFEIRLY